MEFDFIVKRLKKGIGEKPLRWLLGYDPDDVWTVITDRRNNPQETEGSDELRGPEWEAFTSAKPPKSDHFKTRTLDVPSGFQQQLWTIPWLWTGLREVMALCGFTRIDAPDGSDRNPNRTDLERTATVATGSGTTRRGHTHQTERVAGRTVGTELSNQHPLLADTGRHPPVATTPRLDPDRGMPPARSRAVAHPVASVDTPSSVGVRLLHGFHPRTALLPRVRRCLGATDGRRAPLHGITGLRGNARRSGCCFPTQPAGQIVSESPGSGQALFHGSYVRRPPSRGPNRHSS